jgi:hypothetical protein
MSEVSFKLFFSYSHKDETLRNELAKHLTILQRQGVISSWHDRKILAGEEWDHQINDNLNTADIILLLVSSDFLFSNYCWDVEVKKAIERHNQGEACVIPVILRSVDWAGAPFDKLEALPKNAEPVVSRNWHTQDEAFTDVARGIRNTVEALKQKRERLQRERKEAEKLLQIELASEKGVDYSRLRDLLADKNWKEADYETYLVMLQVVGRKDGDWIRSEELLNFPCTDLRTIDSLWVKYSDGHFGFSVQKEIYLSVGGQPDGNYYKEAWEKFGDRVGWRVKGDLISYSSVTFGTSSPRGHLPFGFGAFRGWAFGVWEVVSSLASRLINCNI